MARIGLAIVDRIILVLHPHTLNNMTMDNLNVRARVVKSPNGKLYFLFSRDDFRYDSDSPEAVESLIKALGLQEGDEVGITNQSSGQVQGNSYPMPPLRLAGIFHDTYERLAPSFGYQTRPETRQFRPASPNGQLMIAVCKEVLTKLECSHDETTVILADVSPDRRMEIGRLAGVDYSLGPGSGQRIPLNLCLKCGKVQYKPLQHPEGSKCQHCGSTRPFYLVPSNNDDICGILKICLDCGMVQGNWPYPLSSYEQAEGRLHRTPENP